MKKTRHRRPPRVSTDRDPSERKDVVKRDAPVSILSIAGSTGLKRNSGILAEEFHPNLKGTKAVKVYREMADNEAVLGGALLAMETLVRQAPWSVAPADYSPEAHRIAERVDLARHDMETRWSDFVSEAMSAIVYGFAPFEKTYKICRGSAHASPIFRSKIDDGFIAWRDLAIRSQDSLYEWEWDETIDAPRAMIQQAPPHFRLQRIPMSKLLLFKIRSRKKSPEGRSLLRNSYQSFYYARRFREFEGIGAEKDMTGVPDMQLPFECFTDGATSTQAALRTYYQDILPKFRTGEHAAVVRPSETDSRGQPSGYKLQFIAGGGQGRINMHETIARHEGRELMSLLSEFIVLGMDKVGSFSLHSDKTDLFAASLGAILDSLCELFNDDAIPELCRLNGIPDNMCPQLRHGDIEKQSITELMQFVTQGLQSGAIVGGPKLDAHLHDIGGLPTEESTSVSQVTESTSVSQVTESTSVSQAQAPNFNAAQITAAQGIISDVAQGKLLR